MTTQQTATIDEAMAALCQKHGVYSWDVGLNLRQSKDTRFLCTIHHDGPTKFNGCVMAHGATSEEAMRNALVRLADDRVADQDVPAISMVLAA